MYCQLNDFIHLLSYVKCRLKAKKAVHPSPQENRIVLRNREQARKADAKKLKVAARRLKNSRKQNKNAASANVNTSIQDDLQHEKSDEDNELEEDIILPESCCTKPSTSGTMGQQTDPKNDSEKRNKNINPPFLSSNKYGISFAEEQQADEKNDSNEACKKPGSPHTPEKEKSKQSSSPKITIDSTKREDRNSALPEDKNKHKSVEDKCLKVTKIKVTGGSVSTLSKDFACNIPDIVPSPKEHTKSSEDLRNEKNLHQENFKEFDTEMKSLFEDEKKNPLSSMVQRTAIIGNIRLNQSYKSDQKTNKINPVCCNYNPHERMIKIFDRHIKIDIKVFEGSQVVCYSTNRQKINSSRNGKSYSDAKDETMTKPGEAIANKNLDECDSSSFGQLLCKNIPKEEDQAINIPSRDTLTNFEQHEEIETETSRDLNNISSFSIENPSINNSLLKKFQKARHDYLENHHSILKKFQGRVEYYIKAKSSNISET